MGQPGLPGQAGPPFPSQDLLNYERQCAAGVQSWRPGSVDYPAPLRAAAGEAATYEAAVDIRTNPLPPTQVISAPEAAGKSLSVSCSVQARLRPVGDEVTISPDDWARRTFTPDGVANWVWQVTVSDPGPHQVFLELQPVMTVGGFDFTVADCTGWIVRGLRDIRTEPLVDAHSMVVAFK